MIASKPVKQENAIEVEDLTVAYDEKPVLWDVDLDIPRGKLVAIVGPNGAGKSTLIKAMLGLLKPVTGHVRFANKEIAYVPQTGSIDWDFPATALDVVLMGRYGKLGWIKRPSKHDIAIAREKLARLGMAEFEKRQISRLSGGQQQRVFLARALAQEASIYIMDEPLKGVDAQTEKVIMATLRDIKNSGHTVVAVHHDLNTLHNYFEWVAIINKKLVAAGDIDKVATSENLAIAYRVTASVKESAEEDVRDVNRESAKSCGNRSTSAGACNDSQVGRE